MADAPSILTAEEAALLRRALTIPECWNPRVRAEALARVDAADERKRGLPEV